MNPPPPLRADVICTWSPSIWIDLQICHCGGEAGMPLIAPCFCAGSLKYVHQDCLQRWIKSSDIRRCELCKYTFTMESKVRGKGLLPQVDTDSLPPGLLGYYNVLLTNLLERPCGMTYRVCRSDRADNFGRKSRPTSVGTYCLNNLQTYTASVGLHRLCRPT